jgi:hypothetical protein
MSAVRTIIFIFTLLILALVMTLIGCQPDRSGTATPNSPPRVFVVNVPPDSAHFSRNPDLNWYATDIDGYIRFFRYAVVVESLMVINGVRVTPDVFVEQAAENQFGWDTLRVDLDHPQSTARIRLYANVDFPVDSFVTQYFFIQAQDDQGSMSDIRWRTYSRNNHYPNTHFRNNRVYINAKDANSPAPGIGVTWDGADSADYGRALPPLEYEWRLYGPFLDTSTVYVNLVKENCIYDPIGDSFVNCLDVKVLDLNNLPPSVGGSAQPLMHSKGPNYANDTNDVWVTETQTTLYDVFRGLNLNSTSQYKFIFWVRARDDGFVPDPTPSFGQFYVVEALFEKQVAVLDETGYTKRQGRWAPIDLDTTKSVFYNYIRGAGFEDFDSLSGLHFFFTTSKKNTAENPVDTALPTLVDILSHRVIIYFNDDAEGGPNENPAFGLLDDVFFGLDMGASGWAFARNLGDARITTTPGTRMGKSLLFQLHFGIQEVVVEGWLRDVFADLRNPRFNEQFIGAYANLPGYPHIMVDYGLGSLLDLNRYPRMFMDTLHVLNGLPEVGVGKRTAFAAPLYLYLSKDGDRSFYHGKVCAVAQQIGDMRSACFMFTPLAMDPVPMQQVFQTMLTWLSAKFQGSPGATLKGVEAYETIYADVTQRRARITEFLDYLSENADRKEVARYGISIKPYEVTPDDGVR